MTTFAFSPRRVGAMILRHWYLLRSSWPRLFELVYWPAVQMFMWGFLQMGIAKYPGALAGTVSTFLAAFLLWDILFRGQIGYSMSILEEMMSRNIPNLMISPLSATETYRHPRGADLVATRGPAASDGQASLAFENARNLVDADTADP